MSKKRLNAQKSAFVLAKGTAMVNVLPTQTCHPEFISGSQNLANSTMDRSRNKFGMTGCKNKAAFTLAEVLITLGIIGVVAAMTIPTLIANTRSQQYRSQFKKTLSTLNQAALMSQAQYDFDFGGIDEYCIAYSKKGIDASPLTTKSFCSLFNGTLHGNWDTRDGSFYRGLYGDDFDSEMHSSLGAIFQLSDGATVFAYADHPCTKDNPCTGAIDVNGSDSKPNKVVKCNTASDTQYLYSEEDGWKNVDSCTVDNASIGDLFPIYYYDSTVVPATNAAAYVLNTAK